MTQHTPGPWKVGRNNYGRCVLSAEKVPAQVYDGPDADANARLIAAAPDMLEALRGIATALDKAIDASPEDAPTAHLARIATTARAILAQVDGKDTP